MIERYYTDKLEDMIKQGGPDLLQFNDFVDVCKEFVINEAQGRFLEITAPLLDEPTLHKHIMEWPLGVPGDYSIMERFYSREVRSDRFYRFDTFIQMCAPVEALRFRPLLFEDMLVKQDKREKRGPTIRVLDMACGSGRAIYNARKTIERLGSPVDYLGIDSLPQAVEFSRKLNEMYKSNPYGDKVEFQVGNAVTYKEPGIYSLIWSAGLFDYLSDRLFVRVCQHWLTMLESGGDLVVGNFSTENPMRAYMDLIGWKLKYRTIDQLAAIGARLGHPYEVKSDAYGINLYLIVSKP